MGIKHEIPLDINFSLRYNVIHRKSVESAGILPTVEV